MNGIASQLSLPSMSTPGLTPANEAGYAALAKPSKAVPPTTYRSVEPKLFERILDKTTAGPEPRIHQ